MGNLIAEPCFTNAFLGVFEQFSRKCPKIIDFPQCLYGILNVFSRCRKSLIFLRDSNDFREGGFATRKHSFTNAFLGILKHFSRNDLQKHLIFTVFIMYFDCVFALSQIIGFPKGFQ